MVEKSDAVDIQTWAEDLFELPERFLLHTRLLAFFAFVRRGFLLELPL